MTSGLGTGLEGHGAVVTGAGGGIGRSVALAFARAGARVCCLDVDAERTRETVAMLPSPDNHLPYPLDITHLDAHKALFDRVLSEFGRFDSLAHVAAVLVRRADIDEVTEEDWDRQHDVNLKASFFLMREAARTLRRQGRPGSLTAFSSQGWQTGGFGGSVVYCAAKGGIVSMTRGMARTYAPSGIRVNAVSPGAVDTPMMTQGMTEEDVASFVRQIPLGRMADPDELAGTVVFLASDQASYITGATINVSGGFLMY